MTQARSGINTLLNRLRSDGYLTAEGPDSEQGGSISSNVTSYLKRSDNAVLSPAKFADLISEVHGLPRARLEDLLAGQSLTDQFSSIFLAEAGFYPYKSSNQTRLAVADPSADDVLRAIKLTLGGDVVVEVASFEDIEIALSRSSNSGQVEQNEPVVEGDSGDDVDGLRDLASGAPVVQALDDIFERAVAMRATDIHIEPTRNQFQLRTRIDGVLHTQPVPPRIAARAIVSRIKIMSGLNIAERRLPQDGRTRIKVRSRDFDVRVATMPTTNGEAAILRLLDRSSRLTEFDQLGLSERDATVLRRYLDMPYGLIIVTGPTGSGKTTTLASALTVLNDASRKILTIEDPVEYDLPGISQSQVRPNVGLTFATALRAFLRQDPDVIMVGEMRDTETARICIQASLTGHLVLSTLHTNSAVSAINRLADMGIEPFFLASSVRAIVAQRLVRLLCRECRQRVTLSHGDVERNPRYGAAGLNIGDVVFEARGCERCSGTGFRGRKAIFEVVEISEPVRKLILSRASDSEIETVARAEGMTSLVEDGITKALQGLTSIDEIFRVAALRSGQR